MRVIGTMGCSGLGKTHLIERLIPQLKDQGMRTSVIKHAHHGFDVDYPGKDSYRHRQAGAYEVLVASSQRLAVMREFEQARCQQVDDLLIELDPYVDWVLVEGFRDSHLPKLEVWRAAARKPPIYPEDANVLAVATDNPNELPQATAVTWFDLNDPHTVLEWLLHHADRFAYTP